MLKHLPALLTAIALLFCPALLAKPALAGPKYLKTSQTIKPGQAMSIQVTNRTSETVQVEIPSYAGPYSMEPQQRLKFNFRLRPQAAGVSVLYWTPKVAKPLQAKVYKPNAKTLQVDVKSSQYYQDDSAIYDSELPGTVFIF